MRRGHTAKDTHEPRAARCVVGFPGLWRIVHPNPVFIVRHNRRIFG